MVKASVYAQKWLMSEVLPMAAVAGTTFFVTRNLSINPDVSQHVHGMMIWFELSSLIIRNYMPRVARVNKEDRVAGVLDNYEEGRLYRDHEFRKYLALQHKTVMPAFNEFLTAALPKNTPADPVGNQENPQNQPVQPSCP